ncbi:hypothetical protein ACIBQX_22685 [Nonomuraea sp. NPDC049714]|uniref:hypothetical protein n=1 Tax=Nonomuraea sp. NPDC049714 TaxID=3364357 RepID=UPI003793DA3F
MYKHVFTTLTATVAGLALMAGPVSADDTAAALPCVGGTLVYQAPPATESVLDVISAEDLMQGMFGAVDENGILAEDWTPAVSLPEEDDVEAFAQGLFADVDDTPFLAVYRPDSAPVPALSRAVGVDNLLQGVLGTTMAVCVTGTGVVTTSPYGTTLVATSPYDASAVTTSQYETSAVTTSTRSQSLFATLGVNRLVEGIVGRFTP